MLTLQPDMATLFKQLGLDASPESIDAFFSQHRLGTDDDVTEAEFLSFEQRLTLARMRDEDAEWAELVDTMESLLHKQ